jgi:hypothetical protein
VLLAACFFIRIQDLFYSILSILHQAIFFLSLFLPLHSISISSILFLVLAARTEEEGEEDRVVKCDRVRAAAACVCQIGGFYDMMEA